MGYKLKQENFNKPVTAEAIKVLKLIANPAQHGVRTLPIMNATGTVSMYGHRVYFPTEHGVEGAVARRCHGDNCFCTMTRLHANLMIRYMLRTYPERRADLRLWRIQRKEERYERRRQRQRAALDNIMARVHAAPAHDPARLNLYRTVEEP